MKLCSFESDVQTRKRFACKQNANVVLNEYLKVFLHNSTNCFSVGKFYFTDAHVFCKCKYFFTCVDISRTGKH